MRLAVVCRTIGICWLCVVAGGCVERLDCPCVCVCVDGSRCGDRLCCW